MKQLEQIILETVSFYQYMGLEDILLSMNQRDVEARDDLKIEDLKKILTRLSESKKLRQKKQEGELKWIRALPKRNILQKILWRLGL